MDAIQRRLIPSYIFLTIFSLISVFPLFWMFTAATNTTLEVAQGKLWFGTHMVENFKNLLAGTNLWIQEPAGKHQSLELVRQLLPLCHGADAPFTVHLLPGRLRL